MNFVSCLQEQPTKTSFKKILVLCFEGETSLSSYVYGDIAAQTTMMIISIVTKPRTIIYRNTSGTF